MLQNRITQHRAERQEVRPDSPCPQADGPNGSEDASTSQTKRQTREWTQRRQMRFVRATLTRQLREIKALLSDTLNRSRENESYLQIVAECQKQTAGFANGLLERHALYPAIETVDLLASQIRQLNEQATALAAGRTPCSLLEPLLETIATAAKIAEAKCQSLDMVVIRPQSLDELDPNKHDVHQVIQTDEADCHKRVARILTTGLVYRGTVLRRAKVSVYRHVENR